MEDIRQEWVGAAISLTWNVAMYLNPPVWLTPAQRVLAGNFFWGVTIALIGYSIIRWIIEIVTEPKFKIPDVENAFYSKMSTRPNTQKRRRLLKALKLLFFKTPEEAFQNVLNSYIGLIGKAIEDYKSQKISHQVFTSYHNQWKRQAQVFLHCILNQEISFRDKGITPDEQIEDDFKYMKDLKEYLGGKGEWILNPTLDAQHILRCKFRDNL